MKKDSGSLKMGAERTRSGFNARCLWSWLLADEDEQCGQPDASDVRRHPWKEAASFAAAAALVVAFFWYSLAQIDYRPDFSFLPDFRIRIWDGFLLTIGVSAAAMVLSLLLGILSAAAKLSRVLLLRDLSSLYVVFIRGTPLIMQIYLFFYLVGTAWGVDDRFWRASSFFWFLKALTFQRLSAEVISPSISLRLSRQKRWASRGCSSCAL